MTVEIPKNHTWYCEKCTTFKGENSDVVSEDSEIFKNVKLVHKDHKGWQQGKPKESLKDGVRVDFSKSIDTKFTDEWNEVNKVSLTDIEIKSQLKANWTKLKSPEFNDDEKQTAKEKINELQKMLGVEQTKFPTSIIQKQLDKQWKVLKSKKGSSVTKKEKQTAKEKINELEQLADIPITDFDDLIQNVELSDEIKLLELANKKIVKIRISQNNMHEVYAVVKINNHHETVILGGSRSIHWLNYLDSSEVKSDKIHADDFYKNILNSIISKAQMESVEKEYIYNRISFVDDKITYDLANNNFEAISISKNGIEKIKLDDTTPLFTRSQTTIIQDEPIYDDSDALDELVKLLQIKDDEQLFKVHLITMFLEHIPVPIMLFGGSAGSYKTTTTGSIKRLIDPSGLKKDDNVISIPKKYDDVISTLYHRYCTVLENVSKIDNEISDVFCRAITGSSNAKRELYKNLDEIILTFRRKMIINGVVPNLDNTDLQQRIISYDREIKGFLTDADFQSKFIDIKKRVLGMIFKALQDVLTKINEFEFTPKTRMADFEKWGELISQSLGYDVDSFGKKYLEKLQDGAISSKDGHPIISIIEEIMTNKTEYENTMSQLFNEIRQKAYTNGINTNSKYIRFPKISNQLSKELIVVSPVLEKLGYTVKQWNSTSGEKYGKNVKVVRVEKIEEKSDPPKNVSTSFNENGEK